MIITDTHTHLYSEEFDIDREAVVKRAIEAGVSRFFIPAIDSSYTPSMYALEAQFPENVFLMAGLHPMHVKENFEDELKIIENELNKRNFYAIGEIGLDLYWDKSYLEQQKIVFKAQIKLAKKYKLPIIIHCRKAFDELFAILESEKGPDLFGILHCFSGTYEQALKAITYNLKLGIGGVITYKNEKMSLFLNKIDLKNIVLETDAPFLPPTPHRGKRNESSYLTYILSKLSTIYNVSELEIAKVTTENSKAIFGI